MTIPNEKYDNNKSFLINMFNPRISQERNSVTTERELQRQNTRSMVWARRILALIVIMLLLTIASFI